MPANNASCNPAEVAHIEKELKNAPGNLGVGVLDIKSGRIQLFSYHETDAFSRANPTLGRCRLPKLEGELGTPVRFYPSRPVDSMDSMNLFLAQLEATFLREWNSGGTKVESNVP